LDAHFIYPKDGKPKLVSGSHLEKLLAKILPFWAVLWKKKLQGKHPKYAKFIES
jgi:hypothetical protein